MLEYSRTVRGDLSEGDLERFTSGHIKTVDRKQPGVFPVMMNGPSKMKLFDRFSAAEQRSFALGCLLLVAFAVYANTLRNGFVYDDHHQVEENPYAQSFKYAGKILTGTVWSFQGEE